MALHKLKITRGLVARTAALAICMGAVAFSGAASAHPHWQPRFGGQCSRGLCGFMPGDNTNLVQNGNSSSPQVQTNNPSPLAPTNAVPEPGTLALTAAGLVLLIGAQRHRRRNGVGKRP